MNREPDYESPVLDEIAERIVEFLRVVGQRGATVQRIVAQVEEDPKTVRGILGGGSARFPDHFERAGAIGKQVTWRVNERLLGCLAENEALRLRVAELEARLAPE